jgi:hypothetical protein
MISCHDELPQAWLQELLILCRPPIHHPFPSVCAHSSHALSHPQPGRFIVITPHIASPLSPAPPFHSPGRKPLSSVLTLHVLCPGKHLWPEHRHTQLLVSHQSRDLEPLTSSTFPRPRPFVTHFPYRHVWVSFTLLLQNARGINS